MRLSRALAFVAVGLFTVLPACDPPPVETPDASVDANTPDGSRDAARDAFASDARPDTGVVLDGGDAALDDTGIDAGVDPDADVMSDAGCTSSASCDDGDACTTDSCDVATGACSTVPVDLDDGDDCTDDACDPASGPSHTPVDVDDGDVCTTDACGVDGITHTDIPDCCESAAECASGVCEANLCRPAACGDMVVNGNETDVDCGGDECAPCALDDTCVVDGDCASGACAGGVCVECETASTCPGPDTECQTRTCLENTCGLSFTAAGTATTAQTAGDCRRNQCNGAGGIVSATLDTDLPVDGIQCTSDVCTAGVPSNPFVASGATCSQSGGSFCDGAGSCVQCLVASTCPGSDTECQTRTCSASHACGFSFAPVGTVTSAQTAGDCQRNQCNGTGTIVSAPFDTDLPVDGNQCTDDVCTAGVVSHPPTASGATCSQSGGTVCNGAGACVACLTASTCPGTDTECQTRTCTSGACGFSFTAAGTPTSSQTAGDCQRNECNGSGMIVSAPFDADVGDDGIECTNDVCTAGVLSHPPRAGGTACTQGGGTQCDGAGMCVGCVLPSECPSGNECQVPTCSSGTCGLSPVSAGTPTMSQTPADCQASQCDGAGNIVSIADNADLPADDGNQCTTDVCTAGVPTHPPVGAGTACAQSGGTVCDGAGNCVSPPSVVSTTPADATSAIASTSIAVTFSTAMSPATLTGQTASGACTGSIQVSLDDFATCIAFSSASAVMSGGNTVATFTAAPGLLVNRTYKIRVTTAATSAGGFPLASQFTQATGFMTGTPPCSASVVIADVFGGGGNTGAPYLNDYVVLHNRGSSAVSLAGWSVQYTSATGTGTWLVTSLAGSIRAGGYYLVQMAAGTSGGAALPTPDATGTIAMSATAGKVALVNTATALAGACPTGAQIVDLVGFGATASCFEGSGPTPAPSNTTSVSRTTCIDQGNNSLDFRAGAPTPRNSTSSVSACACGIVNESGAALEADYCTVFSPLSLSVATGAATGAIRGQLYEAGLTEAGGAPAGVRAQVGYGPATANPQWEPGWAWTDAAYELQDGNNDQYQASFTAPAVGSYRYAYRLSLDSGATWTMCDQNAAPDFGAGSNPGLTFDLSSLPVLTVTP